MLSLIEQLDKGVLWRSAGGIHPPELKTLSNGNPIAKVSAVQPLLLALPQVGDNATLLVSVGDRVRKGQCLTTGSGIHYLPVHAPVSGTVTAIGQRPSNHASALPVLTLELTSDGADEWVELQSADPEAADTKTLLGKIRDAGIAGMGGAAFPSHIKLNPVSEIQLLIINGVECEPYITADDRLMREYADGIFDGIRIMERLLQPERIVIAIEDNKPEAAEAMEQALKRSKLSPGCARVTVIPTKYPSGGEKQLIQILTGQEVPSGGIPAQLGIVVHNVGTAYAVAEAVIQGKPLIERVVTVTGLGVGRPGNYWAPIGIQISDLLHQCQFKATQVQSVIQGGPMMGYTLPQLDVPLLKGSNCILVPTADELGPDLDEKACIRCGECAQACPALLLPQQLFWHAKAGEYDKAESFNLRDCIECGCCSYVCPSDIPLVEYYRVAKAALRQDAEEKRQAERAKVRFEARLQRLEEEKQAREVKAREAAEKRQAAMTGQEKDAVAEALARIQAKKAAQATEGQPKAATDTNTVADPKAKVAEAIARAKAKKAAQAEQGNENPEHNEAPAQSAVVDDTKAKVAAAIARAKAKKAAQAEQGNEPPEQNDAAAPSETVDDTKSKVAAAIARAKAKKAALAAGASESDAVQEQAPAQAEAEADNQGADAKAARVAAAIAKAKAKKAAADAGEKPQAAQVDAQISSEPNKEASHEPSQEASAELKADTPVSAADAKAARVAAAIAKAKAKKAAASSESPESAGEPKAVQEVQEVQSAIAQPQAGQALSAEEQKKQRIAAAVAKAKANKAARQQED
ncbi:electron transport complex subunit RsxC [Shewanella sedimentimangrovi]|uniref:Ion-translocating oxidoreductase complex subunit C n=1 Tax=Shewanella sedimentimangrovi TaxID=2814293 RepID=A0ABX7R4T8_9GAMM|nr:electron transport complex subunit RsxC [Shewanella sedimentimangrovi]QSX38852.1 electron transport complex subunit RsxC [Shewanella sedimentimangrovi]